MRRPEFLQMVQSAATLTACTAPGLGSPSAFARPTLTTESTTPQVVSHVCDRSDPLEVRYSPQQGLAVLVRSGQPAELQQQPPGSSFVDGRGPITLCGEDVAPTVASGLKVPMQCTATAP